MSARYVMPPSPSAASGVCPGSPTSSRTLNDLLVCPVCLDNYKDPKILSCFHSFCSKCLESCRQPYRREMACPVCKKVTPLSTMGIQGLQNDFRVQQLKDILLNRPNSPGASYEDAGNPATNPPVIPTPANPEGKTCDLCKTLQKVVVARSHCIQCYMYFCSPCVNKHSQNPLFAKHHVINMCENRATETLFCKTHREHPVRYFCKPCGLMLCTICTLEHDSSHAPEALEKGIIDKYKEELNQSLRTIKSKLSEVKSRTKYLEMVRQSHQRSLFGVQESIRNKTEKIINRIRSEEQRLLTAAQVMIDGKLKENGVANLGEMNFQRSSIESLYSDIQKVIMGSPQDCLMAYEELVQRFKSISETSLPAMQKKKRKHKCTLKFVPTGMDSDFVLGSLRELSLSENDSSDDEGQAGSNPASGYSSPLSTNVTKPQSIPKRTSSIMNAMSPGRKSEVKIGKVKAFSSTPPSPRDRAPSTSPSTISADELVQLDAGPGGSADAFPPDSPGGSLGSIPSPSTSPPASPSSPVLDSPGRSVAPPYQAKVVFKVDQIGGWPGRISNPSSVAFLADGAVVVAECENRLQIFDRNGHSVRIIGWGKVKPQCVAVSADAKIYITDRRERNIKYYDGNGDMCGMWGSGTFGMPSGIAVCSSGNIVVTDVECNSVSIHAADGTVIRKFGSWGNGDYQFNHPTHVAVDQYDNIIVSDSGNSAIKHYDKRGEFLSKFSLMSSKQGLLRRPQGLMADLHGNLVIADRDNHRVSLFSGEGRFIKHLLTKQDGIRYPCDVKLDRGNQSLAVVESHNGFLTKDPHHAIKLFQLQ